MDLYLKKNRESFLKFAKESCQRDVGRDGTGTGTGRQKSGPVPSLDLGVRQLNDQLQFHELNWNCHMPSAIPMGFKCETRNSRSY